MSFERTLLSFTAGVVTGVTVLALVQTLKEEDGKRERTFTKERFEDLIQKQAVIDMVDGAALAPWYREIMQSNSKNLVFFLCRLTEETQTMLGIMNVPEGLDRSHYLVQAAVDKDACTPAAVRLVSFSTMAQSLEHLFGEKDFIILEG